MDKIFIKHPSHKRSISQIYRELSRKIVHCKGKEIFEQTFYKEDGRRDMHGMQKTLDEVYLPRKYKLKSPHTHRVTKTTNNNNKCWQGHGSCETNTFLAEINYGKFLLGKQIGSFSKSKHTLTI